jgi:hypothetical protein
MEPNFSTYSCRQGLMAVFLHPDLISGPLDHKLQENMVNFLEHVLETKVRR